MDESELARAAAVWNAKYVRPAKSQMANTFLLNLQLIPKDVRQTLRNELVKIRFAKFLKREENQALFRKVGSNKAKEALVTRRLTQMLAKEIQRFFNTSI